MNEPNEFYEIQRDTHKYVKEYKETSGRKVIGYLCSYTPEELIFAADAHPFRIFGTSEQIHLADSYLQSYCCSLVRGSLADALSGNLTYLDGVVFPHTCDSMQRLSDIWRINLSLRFHIDLVLPVKLNTDSARDYFAEVIKKFRGDLERGLQTHITDESLRYAIDIYNKIRENLKRIYEIRQENPDVIKGIDVYNIVRSSMIIDRNVLPGKLNEIILDLEANINNKPMAKRKRLVLAGGVCSYPDVYQIIEDAGGVVVWDDLCTGSRYFGGTIGTDMDPIIAIADRYLKRAVCPAKHFSLTGRAENILEMVKKSAAQGVIFLLLKFCDPHAFDYPYLKERLESNGIPSLIFEIEEQISSGEQLKTRLEAFLEML